MIPHVTKPFALNDIVQKKICNALENGNSIANSARLAGLDPRTVERYLAKGRAGDERFVPFLDAVELARAKAEDDALSTIKVAAREGTWQAEAWWLERTRPKRYALKKVDTKQVDEELARMTPEQRAAEWKRLTGKEYGT